MTHSSLPEDVADLPALLATVHAYFDRMYDCDVSRLDEVFAATCHLHGFRDGVFQSWPMPVYRGILEKRASPQSLGAPREDTILLLDVVSGFHLESQREKDW